MEGKRALQELKKFILFLFILAVFISGSVLTSQFGPNEYKYEDSTFDYEVDPVSGFTSWAENQDIVLDQHSHTLYSDGRLTVEQNIMWHINHHFNAMVLTDHDTLANQDDLNAMKEKYQDDIVLIQGIEWTTYRIHLNFLGVSEWTLDIPN